jgi:Spy/CpxP family protein refolding chaperone
MKSVALRPWLIMGLIFLVGIATGVLLMIGLGPRVVPPPAGAQEIGNRWMMHLTYRLQLTEDQQAKIRPIVANAGLQIQAAHREDLNRISGIMEATDKSIAAVLTPEQQEELKKVERDRDMFFSGRMHGMRRMGPGPGGAGGGPPPGAP